MNKTQYKRCLKRILSVIQAFFNGISVKLLNTTKRTKRGRK